jgi:hypothetical protein
MSGMPVVLESLLGVAFAIGERLLAGYLLYQ